MAESIPAPDPHSLLPPLLASLPTSFASSRPPPDFLPLLSPIIRQRLQIHTSTSSSAHDSWIRLLCWDNAKAERLKDIVENANFEPHPSSGEIEVGDVEAIKYKRLDHETLRAQICLPDWDLTALYLWCSSDDGGKGWKLAELLPLDLDLSKDASWSQSVSQANERSKQQQYSNQTTINPMDRKLSIQGDDDDYWAMYDQTPGRTPARHGSINPPAANATDEDYYARYGDVQPAMDNHDPDEAHEEEPGLNGNALQEMLAKSVTQDHQTDPSANPARLDTTGDRWMAADDEDVVHVSHPIPSSPSSRAGSDTVARLELTAEKHAASEIGIRQHISTTVKSMYRLAKSAGMSRDDFDRLVQRELETLSIFDHDD